MACNAPFCNSLSLGGEEVLSLRVDVASVSLAPRELPILCSYARPDDGGGALDEKDRALATFRINHIVGI